MGVKIPAKIVFMVGIMAVTALPVFSIVPCGFGD